MSTFNEFWFQNQGGGPNPGLIGNSLRFRQGPYLRRMFGTAGNRKKWTWSGWFKRGKLGHFGGGGDYMPFSIVGSTGSNYDVPFYLSYNTQNDQPFWYLGTNAKYESKAKMKLRDTSGWYHAVCVLDTDNATASNRWRTWVNGVEITSFDSRSTVTQGYSGGYINNNINHYIGWTGNPNQQFVDGYMSECHFVDGQALAPTDFGEYNAEGVWMPKKVTGLTYGTNGFYLDFSDPNNIGADRSGRGNDWTATGFELTNTTSPLYDWVADSPTNNFATINPLGVGQTRTGGTISEANLRIINNSSRITGTTLLPKVKCYWEDFVIRNGGSNNGFGIVDLSSYKDTQGSLYYKASGRVYINNVLQDGAFASLVNNSTTIGWTYDPDTDEVGIRIDDVLQGTWTLSTTTGTGQWAPVITSGGSVNTEGQTNFGQRPFKYTPPAGFEPLSTAVQPAVAITNPSKHFSTILDTGANILTSAQNTFPNGLWWIKDRANASTQHQLVSSVLPGSKVPRSPSTASAVYAAPAGNSIAWCWAAPATGVTNNDGSIESTVYANAEAGFSMIRFTGTSSAGTIGHGLPSAPKFIISQKPEDADCRSAVYHAATGASKYMFLGTGAGDATSTAFWGGVEPTDTVYSVGTGASSHTNKPGTQMMHYAWCEIPGYSSIGSYVGNGNADGPFIYTGHRVGWVLVKRSNSTNDWLICNSVTSPHNVVDKLLWANLGSAEYLITMMDFTSNGFKIRTTNPGWNASGGQYVYMAFAEHPFGGSNVSPSPAR